MAELTLDWNDPLISNIWVAYQHHRAVQLLSSISAAVV